jgi:hypothetical protein
MTERFVDADKKEIIVGSRVTVDGYLIGRVISISDPDGDVDDDGRQIGIAPKITVEWGDGEDERFETSYTGSGYGDDAPWQCEDLEVVG